LLKYLLWQFYFACFTESQQSSVRQQACSLLHFPFHVGLVLLIEGASKFILVHHVFAQITSFWNAVAIAESENLDGQLLADCLNATITSFNLGDSGIGSMVLLSGITQDLLKIVQNNATVMSGDDYSDTVRDLNIRIQVALYSRLGIESIDPGNSLDKDVDTISSFFEAVYIYFFIGAGSVMLFFALFKWLGYSGSRNWRFYISIVTRALVGIALMSLTATLAKEHVQSNYTSSSMVLPTVLLSLIFGKSISFFLSSPATILAARM
jgi:hypothetical protein